MKLTKLKTKGGQSLVEVLIALGIGAILIGTAAIGVSFMLKSSSTNENLQAANGLIKEMSDRIRSFSSAGWSNINSLATTTNYFLIPSSSSFIAVQGEEALLGNDVLGGLAGRWNFDEATGMLAYDSSENGNNGALYNNPTRATSTCKISNCLTFDGSTMYVNMGDPADGSLDFGTGDFSIASWFKLSSLPSNWKSLINKGASGAVGYGMEISSGNQVTCSIQASGGTDQHVYGSVPVAGSWHHAACVFDRDDKVYVYVNGLVVASSTYSSGNTGSVSTDSYGVNVGRSGAGSRYFNGSLDDIRIYNRALSPEEISRIYSGNVYERYFVAENVCRTNDAPSTISGTEPCLDGSVIDPSTKKVSSYVEWNVPGGTGDTRIVDYITRWKNEVFRQTDWSGGEGDEEVYTQPGTTYATSTNIDAESGSIRIHNL